MLCSDMKLQRRPYVDLKFRTLLGKINSDTQGGQCLIKTHKADPGWLQQFYFGLSCQQAGSLPAVCQLQRNPLPFPWRLGRFLHVPEAGNLSTST